MQRFLWEKMVPVLICACICIYLSLLASTGRDNLVVFGDIVNDFDFVISGIKLTAQVRSILLSLSAICILPYVILFKKRMILRKAESWIKLGLVFGIAMLFMGCVAAPDSYSVDPAWFSQMEGANQWDAMNIFDQVVEEGQLLSAEFQNRLLLTSSHSLLLPLLLGMVVQIAQWQRKHRNIRSFASILLIVFSLTTFGGYAVINSDYHAIYYAVIGTILFYGDNLLAKSNYVCPMPAAKEDWKALLIHGIAVLTLYGCVVAMFVLNATGVYQQGGLFSPFEITVSVVLVLWLVVVLLAAKNRTILVTALPLYLLMWMAVACTSFIFISLHHEDIISHITVFYPGNYDYHVSAIFVAPLWALTCVACTIYAIYFLYDHGLKRHPWVIAGVTALLIVSMYIPEYEFIPQTCVTLCALRNLLLGAIAPILVILVGISSRHTQESIDASI